MKFLAPIQNFSFAANVSQLFGVNRSYYQSNFGLLGHNGIDIVVRTDKLGYGTLVRAAHDFDTCSLETDFPTKKNGNGIRLYQRLSFPIIVNKIECHMIETI